MRLRALLLAIALAALTIPRPATAAQVTLTWQAPSTNTDGSPLSDLAGYRVYVGTSTGNYALRADTGNQQTYLVDNLGEGSTYYFAVTAYNTAGAESAYSEEVSDSIPAYASAPLATQFTVADALAALRYSVGLSPLTPSQQTQYDVAPVGADGMPRPDGVVNTTDALAILRNAVGLTTW